MVEILAEPPLADRELEVGVRGADDPAVEDFLGGAPEAAHRLLFERGEDLRLDVRRQEPDLVEEQHPARGRLEQADLGAAGVGERAPLEAEQLPLQQRLGDRRAVEVDERSPCPRTQAVEEPRHEPLARSRLALDEDGRQAGSVPGETDEPAKVAPNRCDRRALSDQLLEVGHLNGQAYSNGRFDTTLGDR
jgi:hypothetical protein